MKEIAFPGLNLKFQISSIAIKIGNIPIYWYAIFIVFAIIVAMLFCKKDDKKYGIYFQTILEIFVFVIPISIITARLYYVLFKLDYYLQNHIEIFRIKDGGLAIYGGILGGVITIVFYCKKKHINVLDVLDYIAPYLALGQAIGRWGNFFNMEAYGSKTSIFLRMGIVENGKYIEVHPTFLYESIADFFIFLFLYKIRNKIKYKGQITYLYIMLYALIRIFIEGLRIDSLMLGKFRISQLISVLLFIIFSILLLVKRKNKNIK